MAIKLCRAKADTHSSCEDTNHSFAYPTSQPVSQWGYLQKSTVVDFLEFVPPGIPRVFYHSRETVGTVLRRFAGPDLLFGTSDQENLE